MKLVMIIINKFLQLLTTMLTFSNNPTYSCINTMYYKESQIKSASKIRQLHPSKVKLPVQHRTLNQEFVYKSGLATIK